MCESRLHWRAREARRKSESTSSGGEWALGDAPAFGRRGRTVLTVLHYPGVPPAPHGSSVIIFTTAAIQQCRINSVRYCGPVRTGILRRRRALLKVSIRGVPRARILFFYVGLNNLSPLSRARRAPSRRRASPLSFEPGRGVHRADETSNFV